MTKYEIINGIANDGSPIYIYKTIEKSVVLNYKGSPKKEMERFLLKGKLENNQVVFVIGVGNGEIINNLFHNYKDIPMVIIIEPFEEINVSSSILEKVNESKNIVFLKMRDTQPLIISSILEKFKGLDFKILIHPKYEQTQSMLITETLELIKKSWDAHVLNINTLSNFRTSWITEPTLNLAYTYEMDRAEILHKKFKKKGALLIAAGPSLNDHIEFIKNAKNHMYIFCVGSALKALLKNNIVPDFVVVIDSSLINYEAHFKDVNYNGTAIFCTITNHLIVKNHKGSSLSFLMDEDNITKIVSSDSVIFPSFPSVALSTLHLIYYFGFEEVYLIGQDLAYRNNEYYARGVAEGNSIHEGFKNRKIIYVDSNDGQKVGTDDSLYVMLQGLNDLISYIKNDIKIFNLSISGAKINNVPFVESNKIHYQRFNKDVQYSIKKNDVSKKGKEKILEVVNKLHEVYKLIKSEEEKIKRIHSDVVNIKDTRLLLKCIKKIRQEPLIEEALLEQLKYDVQQISNHFEYNIENLDRTTNEQRKEMRDYIHVLFIKLKIFIEELLNNPDFQEIKLKGLQYFE